MGKSYRKQPVWKDHNRGMKQIANRKVRRALNRNYDLRLPHKSYKKFCESWDICDYLSLVPKTFEEYYQQEVKRWYRWQNSWLRNEPFPERKKVYREWIKWYRGK